jgi:cobalt-zinc-cadmium efflux system outer membrane protein
VTLAACIAGAAWPAGATSAPAAPIPDSAAPAGVLTLERALELAATLHPEMRSAAARVDAASARSRDAGRWRPPVLTADAENLGEPRTLETTIALEQPIELGGDRAARTGLAEALARAAEAERDVRAREIQMAALERFITAWALQEKRGVLVRAEHAATATATAASERLRAGAAPAFELERARSIQALRETERLAAEAELALARRRLARAWGADTVAFDALALDTAAAAAAVEDAVVHAALASHPGRRRATALLEAEHWRIREADAARTPDLALSGGVRRFGGPDLTVFTAGITIPLWGGSGAARDAARADHVAAGDEARGADLRLRDEVADVVERHRIATATWTRLRAAAEPAARAALAQIEAGYRAGRVSAIEVQDGQRGVIETELLILDAAAAMARTRAALTILTGTPVGGAQ